MYKEHKIGVVVLAHNEENHIKDTIETLPDFVDKIYVIDDGSTDKTAEIVKTLTEQNQRIHLLQHEVNKGPGAALVTGYKAALKEEMDVIVKMDGDNQMDPEQLPNLLEPIIERKADYTKENRLLSPEYRRGMTKWRFFGNSLLTMLTKIGSGYWQLMDPQNGYTAISKSALERISLDSIYPWYGYCNDLLVKLNVYGFRVMDIVMPAKYGREKSVLLFILGVQFLLFAMLFDMQVNERESRSERRD